MYITRQPQPLSPTSNFLHKFDNVISFKVYTHFKILHHHLLLPIYFHPAPPQPRDNHYYYRHNSHHHGCQLHALLPASMIKLDTHLFAYTFVAHTLKV